MGQGISRAELDAWGTHLETSIEKLMTAKFSALPCSGHNERIAGLAAKIEKTTEKVNLWEGRAAGASAMITAFGIAAWEILKRKLHL